MCVLSAVWRVTHTFYVLINSTFVGKNSLVLINLVVHTSNRAIKSETVKP